jgi:iron complex transport system substrate-binding protein
VRAALAVAIAALAAQPAGAAPGGKPQRIMTMNQCADLIALQLVPRSRIASVTYLAREGAEQLFPGADAGIPVNHGTAEDVINVRPDLILAGDLSTPVTRRLAKRVGARVVELKSAQSFADVRATVRQVGEAVGEPARAAQVIATMDAKLAWLAAHPPKRRTRVVAWSGGTTVPGKGTLANEIIEAAGALNVAALPGIADTTFDVEQLLIADPDAVLYGTRSTNPPSLSREEGRHRVVRRLWGDRRIGYSELSFVCGLPQSADTALRIRAALDALPQRPARAR